MNKKQSINDQSIDEMFDTNVVSSLTMPHGQYISKNRKNKGFDLRWYLGGKYPKIYHVKIPIVPKE